MNENHEVDVIIVGAGLAGLTAGLQLKKRNYSFVILEANLRAGGRIQTVMKEPFGPVELGAQWISPKHTRMIKLLSEFGLHTVSTYRKGNHIYEFNGQIYTGKRPALSPLGLLDLYQFSRKVNHLSKKINRHEVWEGTIAQQYDQISMEQLLQTEMYTAEARNYVRLLVEEVLCSKLYEVSSLDVLWCIRTSGSLNYIQNAEELWIREGMGTLIQRVVDAVGSSLYLNKPVLSITYKQNEAIVQTRHNSWKGKKVILAIPPNMQSKIQFHPSLPTTRTQFLERAGLPSVMKMVLVYDKPFWRKRDFSGTVYSDKSLIQLTMDTSLSNNSSGVVTMISSSHSARFLETLSTEDRKYEMIKHVSKWFGKQAKHPIAYFEKSWSEEVWVRGGYGVHFGPGMITNFGKGFQEPIGPIHIAGTETAAEWRLYLEGAAQSGEQAVNDVLEDLS